MWRCFISLCASDFTFKKFSLKIIKLALIQLEEKKDQIEIPDM